MPAKSFPQLGIGLASNRGMNTNAHPERFVVLAALDGVLSDRVALVAARFAADIAGGELHLVHVIGTPPAGGTNTTAALAEGRARLEEAGASAGRGRSVGHVATGSPPREILQVAAQLQADLILVGTHARTGVARLLLGSVAEEVVRRASCPVLVVREKDYHAGLAPEIEPPCADCLAAQVASNGEKMWCVRHSQHHPHGHPHYEVPESFALGSSIIRPS
jgi:nucleotide-binding universal stress UspA family protein